MIKYLVFVFLLLVFVVGRKWHTSQRSFNQLYDLQNEHFEVFYDYLDLETKRLEELKINIITIKKWYGQKITTENVHNHISIVKRMTFLHHHLKIDELLNNKQSIEVLNKIDEHKDFIRDYIYIIFQSLRRLQRFYGVIASDMAANRSYDDIIFGDPFNACECFVMAEYCMKLYDMYGVIDWAVEAYKKWQAEGRPECIDTEMLYRYIVTSSAFTGFNFQKVLSSKEPYIKHIEKFEQHFSLMKNDLVDMHERRAYDVLDEYNRARGIELFYGFEFINICKSDISLRTLTKGSKCRYQTKNSHYRLLIPFEEEDINSDPSIKIYHNFLFEEEISKIKTKAMERMIETEKNTSSGSVNNEFYRLGRISWLSNEYAENNLSALNTRIELLTEFTVDTAESYQYNKEYGNRLITVILYLSDLEKDGCTMFPMLKVIAPVEKGTALVWQNLHKSNGTGHHTAQLKGNKWNKCFIII
uniref:Prolyl 4-hydroxylase subunit alpha-2 n=1 Tax=Sipha flava TaxID=143950 RepID=A0A2S2QN67_9HEMI